MNRTVGILAHVDAGKTTFSEQVLYRTQAIRQLGRVDNHNAFLDDHPQERQRGITIFSGQAVFQLNDDQIYWLDTPGHVDFSAEMERALSVMDLAVLLVSSADGIQSHTETLWQLLSDWKIPTVIFLNKTDREAAQPDQLFQDMLARFSENLIDLRSFQSTCIMDQELCENLASRDDDLLERWCAGHYDESLWRQKLCEWTAHREVFPVLSGSGLRGDGIDGFLKILSILRIGIASAEGVPSGRVYRVRHDDKGQRICFFKLTQGHLRIKDELSLPQGNYKVNELRRYHGEKFTRIQEACAGELVAVPGLDELRPGDTFGQCPPDPFRIEPMVAADLLYDQHQYPAFKVAQALRQLEAEDPSLAVEQRESLLTVHTMGRIHMEILTQSMLDRFGIQVSFGPFRVLYRETIASPVIGIGHYEPLRHYAECHLRLMPAEQGSGVRFRSLAHVDDLALNWQRLIETHVLERTHQGVLTGSPLTDVYVELLCGRSHPKHTEGGDFRQATYRAIRNALMQANNILLEPICGFSLRIPTEQYGTVTEQLNRIHAEIQPPHYDTDYVTITGSSPYSLFSTWQESFSALTHGHGILRVWLSCYAPCHNAEEVIQSLAYNPLADTDNTPDSVFCAHGAGFNVRWDHVKEFAHCHSSLEDT